MIPPKRFLLDKRRAPRAPHDSVLELFDEKGARLAAVGTLADVSSTGASFRCAHRFAKGASLRARLRLFGREAFEVSARVVRVKELSNAFVYAVAFNPSPKGI